MAVRRLKPNPEQTISTAAPAAVEAGEDRLMFPECILLPLSVRGGGLPGQTERSWSGLSADVLGDTGTPSVYSVALRRQPPESTGSRLRARRTLFEGLLMAAAEKTGRRPTLAEQAADTALDAAESRLALGAPAFQVNLLSAYYARRSEADRAERARRGVESNLLARGLLPQRLVYIAERALHYLQPGGNLSPGLDETLMLAEECLPLLPPPTRRISPGGEAVWLGSHAVDGRDVYFDFATGFDPSSVAPPHATTLILGEMGAGKTTLMRWILLQRLLQGRAILSIDPEGENNALCRALGGRVVPAGAPDDPDTCLLHPLQGDSPTELLFSARFLVSALGLDPPPAAQAALHEAVRRRWENRPGPMSLADLIDTLAVLSIPEAGVLVGLLRPFARGGLLDGFFDRPNALIQPQVSPGQWLNFDLSGLREESRGMLHAVLAWFFYHAVTVGRQPMDIYIDEGWRLMRTGAFVDLLDELGRRARKRGIGVMLTTHLPGDFAGSAAALRLTSTALIGRIGPEEAYAFFHSIGVAEADARRNGDQAGRLPPRCFLAASAAGRGALFPVNVNLPPVWLELLRRTSVFK